MRNLFTCTLLGAALALQPACIKTAPPLNVFHIGDKVQTGSLAYTVLEAKWRAQIGEGPLARVPEHRFLVIHLTVTNSGARDLDVPALTITDQAGQTDPESMDGRAVPYWIGMIRKVKPANTLDGAIVFDVEPKSYKLKLDDGSGAAMAMVELPLQFETGEPAIPSPIR
jgi:hypothetical protein